MAEVHAAVRENEGYLADSAFTIMKRMRRVRAESDGGEKSCSEESDYDEKSYTSDDEDVDDESTPTTSPIKDAEIKYVGYESFDSMNGLMASSVATRTLSDIEVTPEPTQAEIESQEDSKADTNVDSEDDESFTPTNHTLQDDNPFSDGIGDSMDGKDYLLTDGDLEVIMDPTPPISARKRKMQTQEDEDVEQQTEKRIKLSPFSSAPTPTRSEFARYLGAGLLGALVGAAAMFTGLIAASDGME